MTLLLGRRPPTLKPQPILNTGQPILNTGQPMIVLTCGDWCPGSAPAQHWLTGRFVILVRY